MGTGKSDITKRQIAKIKRPTTTQDYKLTNSDVKTLRILFEGYTAGTGAAIARKLLKAEQEGRTDVYLTFLEKDFTTYRLEGTLTDEEAVALEKIMKKKYKESFDDYWRNK